MPHIKLWRRNTRTPALKPVLLNATLFDRDEISSLKQKAKVARCNLAVDLDQVPREPKVAASLNVSN